MRKHRLANIPPAGPPRDGHGTPTGQRLVLCGRHVYPEHYTTSSDEVTCAVCYAATSSARTVQRDRLATS